MVDWTSGDWTKEKQEEVEKRLEIEKRYREHDKFVESLKEGDAVRFTAYNSARQGYAGGLGIVISVNQNSRTVLIKNGLDEVKCVHYGNVHDAGPYGGRLSVD